MRVCLDTSVLVKKYIAFEPGVDRVAAILSQAGEVVVSPVTRIEMYHVFHRLEREGYLTSGDLQRAASDFERDYGYFHVVAHNEALEREVIRVLAKIPLKSLDAIHLASALMANAKMFYTSDRKLFVEARKMTSRVELI